MGSNVSDQLLASFRVFEGYTIFGLTPPLPLPLYRVRTRPQAISCCGWT